MSWSGPKKIECALASVIGSVYHFDAGNAKAPYVVWGEDAEGSQEHADNRRNEWTITGTVDYFTKNTEDYAVLQRIEDALQDAGALIHLVSCRYEDDTKLCHYEWSWEIA